MMDTIILHTAFFLIQVFLFFIVVVSLWIVAKAKPWIRVVMFIAATGAIGILGLSMGIASNLHTDQHRFEEEYAYPQKLLLEHLSSLIEQKRYTDVQVCITKLKEYKLELYPKKGSSHTNYTEIVRGLIDEQQQH